MPTDVKAIVSGVVILVALGLVYWSGRLSSRILTSSCFSLSFFLS